MSSDDYWASSSRQLEEDEPQLEAGNAKLDDNVELDEKTGRPIAEPVKHDNGEKRFSMRDLAVRNVTPSSKFAVFGVVLSPLSTCIFGTHSFLLCARVE